MAALFDSRSLSRFGASILRQAIDVLHSRLGEDIATRLPDGPRSTADRIVRSLRRHQHSARTRSPIRSRVRSHTYRAGTHWTQKPKNKTKLLAMLRANAARRAAKRKA